MAWSSTRPFILISTSDPDVQHCVQLRCIGEEAWSQKVCTLDPPEELYMACERNHELQLKCVNESSHFSVGSRVIWRHNGTEVSDGVDNSGNVSVLRIPNTTWTDGGSYSCVSETNVTIRSYSVRIGTRPSGPSLECQGHNYTLVTCTWNLSETNLPTSSSCDRENCRLYDLPYGNFKYCVEMMTRPPLMEGPGIWSEEKCLLAPPNRPNVEMVVPSCRSFSTEDCSYAVLKDMERRAVNISWKVQAWEDGPEPPQGVTGFNLSIHKRLSGGLQYNRTILHNLTESDPKYPYNKTFSTEIPDLLVKAEYTVHLSAFNSAGSTRAREFDIERMTITERKRHPGVLFSILLPIVFLFLVLAALIACSKQYHELNSFHIPEPYFPKEFEVSQMVKTEREVFDTLRCRTTEWPQDDVVYDAIEDSSLLDSNQKPYGCKDTSCDFEDYSETLLTSSTHSGGKDSNYQQLYSCQGLSLRPHTCGDDRELSSEGYVIKESTIGAKSTNSESAPSSKAAMNHAIPNASLQGYVSNQTDQGYVTSPSWPRENGVTQTGASPYSPNKDPSQTQKEVRRSRRPAAGATDAIRAEATKAATDGAPGNVGD
ncbi:uncharacterized protein [Diadema setosum]|uniref:uncharacterized protein n=1 Tax=Diadema setosum TaxID=31175 RepID=UPI003B3B6914